MRSLFKLFALLFLISLLSCETAKKTQQVMDSWVGQTKQKLIMSWGPPQRTTSDGNGGEVLVYANSSYNAYNRSTIYNYKMFYVNDANMIYHWRTDNSVTPPQQIDVYIR